MLPRRGNTNTPPVHACNQFILPAWSSQTANMNMGGFAIARSGYKGCMNQTRGWFAACYSTFINSFVKHYKKKLEINVFFKRSLKIVHQNIGRHPQARGWTKKGLVWWRTLSTGTAPKVALSPQALLVIYTIQHMSAPAPPLKGSSMPNYSSVADV